MIQAEDRAHRVGQKDSVLVQYMVAKNTADTEIWQLLADKLKVLGEVNLSDEKYVLVNNQTRIWINGFSYGNANNREKICTSGLLITDFFKEIDETEEDETPAKREKMDDCNSIVEIHDEDEGNSRLEKRDDYSIIEVDDEEGN
jgi:hypothetical protein